MKLSAEQKKIVVVLLAASLVCVLNQTLLSPALPSIMRDLSVDSTTVQWLTSGYSLVEAIILPLSSYLIGRFTTRQLFIGGMCIFAFGSLLAAIAPFFFILLLGRMCQASATGFLWPMVFTVILNIFPRERRGSAMGIVSLVIGFAPAAGPSLSGVLVESIGWRALFIMVVALATIIILAGCIILKNFGPFERTTFDKLSVALSSLGLLSLLYGLSTVTSSPNIALSLGLIAFGAILMVFFVKRQFALEVPLLRVEVLKSRPFATAVLVVASFQAALIGTDVLLPIYLQDIHGLSALQTGLIMLPGAVIGAITAMLAGRLFDRFGARKLTIPGTLLAFLGGLGLSFYAIDTPVVFIIGVYTCMAIGIEFTMTPINTWGINSLDNSMIQHANATSNTINQIGASLGTAILVSLSATSAFLYPNLGPVDQAMAGDHIAFCFSALLLFLIFVTVFRLVHDRKTEPSKAADYEQEIVPAMVDSHASVALAMNRDPYFVNESATIREVTHRLVEKKTSGLPVVNDAMEVVGFISDGDIMKYIGRSDSVLLDPTGMMYRVSDNDSFSQRVSQLMDLGVMNIATANVISVNAETPLEDLCRLMTDKRLKKVPVIDQDKLVGTISRSDIIRSTMENLAAVDSTVTSAPDAPVAQS